MSYAIGATVLLTIAPIGMTPLQKGTNWHGFVPDTHANWPSLNFAKGSPRDQRHNGNLQKMNQNNAKGSASYLERMRTEMMYWIGHNRRRKFAQQKLTVALTKGKK